MERVEFNGLGQPQDAVTRDGDVLILVQGRDVSIVRLEILSPDEFGPSLDHALNERELESEAFSLVAKLDPSLLCGDRHYTLRCPPDLAARAHFRTDA